MKNIACHVKGITIRSVSTHYFASWIIPVQETFDKSISN